MDQHVTAPDHIDAAVCQRQGFCGPSLEPHSASEARGLHGRCRQRLARDPLGDPPVASGGDVGGHRRRLRGLRPPYRTADPASAPRTSSRQHPTSGCPTCRPPARRRMRRRGPPKRSPAATTSRRHALPPKVRPAPAANGPAGDTLRFARGRKIWRIGLRRPHDPRGGSGQCPAGAVRLRACDDCVVALVVEWVRAHLQACGDDGVDRDRDEPEAFVADEDLGEIPARLGQHDGHRLPVAVVLEGGAVGPVLTRSLGKMPRRDPPPDGRGRVVRPGA